MNEEFGYSVLVVEDEAVNRLTLERMLTKKGCLVSCVENGQEAVAALESTSYDCVLMDVRMPVMDGIQATKKIRSLDRRSRNVPVIALTAYAMPGDREKCLDAGMDDGLTARGIFTGQTGMLTMLETCHEQRKKIRQELWMTLSTQSRYVDVTARLTGLI